MRHGGRSRRGADFIPVPPKRGKPILVIGGGKNPTFRREVDSAGANQDPSLGGPERRLAGTPAGDDVTLFWTVMGEELGAEVEFVNGATNIDNVNFFDYSILAVAGDQWETYYGGLTAAEHDALSVRADDVRDFLADGGGLVASLSPFRTRFFQTPLLPFTGLPAYRVSSTWGSYAYLRTAIPSALTSRFFAPDDLEHMWQSQSGPTFAPATYCLPTAVPNPPVVATGAGSFAEAWAQTPVPWTFAPGSGAPPAVLPGGGTEFEITVPADPSLGLRHVVGMVSRIRFDNATQWRPGVGTFYINVTSTPGADATWKGVYICHTRAGSSLGTFSHSIPLVVGVELTRTGLFSFGESSSGWTVAEEATRSTTPIAPGDEMLIMWIFGNEGSTGDRTIRVRFDQIDFWSFTGYTDIIETSLGGSIGLAAEGLTVRTSAVTGAAGFRWMHTYPSMPEGMSALLLAGGTAIRYRTEPAIAAAFNSVQDRGTVVLVGVPWEDGVFYDPAAVGVPGQTLPKTPTATVPDGFGGFIARPVGDPQRQHGAFDVWVNLMQAVVDAVESAGVRVARTGILRRPWASGEENQL